MVHMVDFILNSLLLAWHLLRQAAPFFLFGLLLSGLIKLIMPPEQVSKHLGTKGIGSVLKAALVGVPLPLCSCSVLPVASSLKRQGAGKGAVAAFLVSTPESGVDSIAISWALLDPIMTVARPIAAFFSAAVAGVIQNFLPDEKEPSSGTDADACSCSCSCGDQVQTLERPCCAGQKDSTGAIWEFWNSVTTIWTDLAVWFFAGLLIAGVIAQLVPSDFLNSHLGGGLYSMLLMLLVGTPIYICATASTPVAAAMIMKGMSPGTALVFLMVGPATNITSMAVLLRILGKVGTAAYLFSIAACSIACGLFLDRFYKMWSIEPSVTIGKAAEMVPDWLMTFSALLLLSSLVVVVFEKAKKTKSM